MLTTGMLIMLWQERSWRCSEKILMNLLWVLEQVEVFQGIRKYLKRKFHRYVALQSSPNMCVRFQVEMYPVRINLKALDLVLCQRSAGWILQTRSLLSPTRMLTRQQENWQRWKVYSE